MAATEIKLNLFNRVNIREKALFTRALSAMISAGLPLIKALNILARQTDNKYFASVISNVIAKLEEGEGIARSLSYHPGVFDDVYVSSVKAAESSGKFDEILKDLAEQQERDYKLFSSVRSALAYPVFIVCAMIIVAVVLLIAVVPKLESLFTELDLKIPIMTAILIGTGNFILHYWYILILIIVFAVVWVRYFLRSEKGKEIYGRLIIRTPVVKEMFLNIYMARFCRVFSILIGAGVPITESIRLLSMVMDNYVYKRILVKITDQIQRGVPLSTNIAKYPEFHPIVAQMASVGEQTGKLDEVMSSLARFFDDEATKRIATMMSLLEPILLIIIGLGVGVIVFSIIMPIYQISGGIK